MAAKARTPKACSLEPVYRVSHPPIQKKIKTAALQAGPQPDPRMFLEVPAAVRPKDILALQRASGNRAAARVQARLRVGAASDRFEQEADLAAERVMPASRSADHPQRMAGSRDVPAQVLSRLDDGPGGFEVSGAFEDRLAARRGGGSPLPGQVKAFMEPRFGADFSGVQLHTGQEPAGMNRLLNAQAFTHGQDIYLGDNSPSPGTQAGNRLLAHELAHVVQQSHSGIRRISRWGGLGEGITSHGEVTQKGVESLPENIQNAFSEPAKKYLVDHSGDLDVRVRLLGAQFYQMILKQKMQYQWGGRGMYASHPGLLPRTASSISQGLGSAASGIKEAWKILIRDKSQPSPQEQKAEADKRKQQEQKLADDWTNIVGYERNAGEMPNHAEAGMYREDKTSANIQRRDDYISRAAQEWKSKNPNQALQTLSLALHCAQDRGSHGDGRPGLGHDPRQVVPPPNKKVKMAFLFYNKNPGWKEGDPIIWDEHNCDKKEKNRHGFDIGVKQTAETITKFYEKLDDKERLALKNWKPGKWYANFGRGLGRFLGDKGVIS
jgi:hypothetical protein